MGGCPATPSSARSLHVFLLRAVRAVITTLYRHDPQVAGLGSDARKREESGISSKQKQLLLGTRLRERANSPVSAGEGAFDVRSYTGTYS